MAHDQTRRLTPEIQKEDKDAVAAINGFSDYAPSNSNYSKANLAAAQDAVKTAQDEETRTKGIFDAARDAANAAEWALHNLVLKSKDQVIAQYGDDSDQVQAVGLKKKSEHKKPSARTPKPTP